VNGFSLWLRYAGASIRAQMQYPASAFMLAFGQFAVTVIEVAAVFALFDRFGQLRGWSLAEVAVFYGVANLTYATSEALCRGFDAFGESFVRNGAFDRILLRPRSAALQVMGHEFRLSRFGRLFQGFVVLTVAGFLGFHWTGAAVLMSLWSVIGGVALFTGLFVLQAVLSIWTVDGIEVANMLTHGGVTAGQYPLSIYAEWFRGFLTVVIPLACVLYYPVVGAIGRTDPLGAPGWLLPIAPLAGFLFLAVSFIAWRFGIGKYTSTGS
jgi:ABC-2 type transport system permease protein